MELIDFRKTIEQRQELLLKLKKLRELNLNHFSQKEESVIVNKINRQEDKLIKSSGFDFFIEEYIFWMFNIKLEDLDDELKEFFKNLNKEYYMATRKHSLRYGIKVDDKFYNLGINTWKYSNEEEERLALICLTDGTFNEDWNILFEDYPEIKELLWRLVKENIDKGMPEVYKSLEPIM